MSMNIYSHLAKSNIMSAFDFVFARASGSMLYPQTLNHLNRLALLADSPLGKVNMMRGEYGKEIKIGRKETKTKKKERMNKVIQENNV